MSERVERWKEAWESRDADRAAAMYLEDATHESGLVTQIYPEAGGGILHGRAEIREYARRGLARYVALRFEIVTIIEDGTRSGVEYRRHSNLDGANPKHVFELLEWEGDALRAVRVFHA